MDRLTVQLAAQRLAPVQAASWGHPETTGLPTMDYYLSAAALEPPGAAAHYVERLVPLPNCGVCYEPISVADSLPDLAALGLPAGTPLMLSPGMPFKYAPEHDALWVAIAFSEWPSPFALAGGTIVVGAVTLRGVLAKR